jgi:predicted DNA-binding protein
MSMTRTQIYLPAELRKRVDERADAEGKPMAEVVREALEHHLAQPPDTVLDVLDDTFGSVLDAWAPPRDERDRI